jgi:predicted metal-binding protein
MPQEDGCILNKQGIEKAECEQSELNSYAVVAPQINMSSYSEKTSMNMTFNDVTSRLDILFRSPQNNRMDRNCDVFRIR